MERMKKRLAYDWRFKLYPEGEAPAEVFAPEYDDTDWETVRVPHDWAISAEFDMYNDSSHSPIVQDGIEIPVQHSGRTGGLPIIGLGVYRLALDIPAEACGQKLFLEFDGVMWDSDVYVNGKHAFFNHFGYKSFCVDITDLAECGKTNNVAVAARVYHDCSRWYPGAGIYRNVYLVQKAPVHIAYDGIWMRQVEIADGSSTFLLTLEYTGPETVSFHADILDPDGKTVVQVDHGTYLGELSDIFEIPDVRLWDLDTPNLYTANISLLDETGTVQDTASVRFGVRKIKFTADGGFYLNDRPVKMNGVCNHHDLGSLGAAFNTAALRRQLRIMREMGVNAIRTSHNPPARELLDLCDEMGFLVMDEFFDEWYIPKISSGYSKYYREHAAQDAVDIIRRDRNHPSVVMWSIGNEINEQHDKEGWRAAMMLTETVHRTDPTRPTTAGFDRGWDCFTNHLANFVDVVGLNYKPHMYADVHKKHPDMVLIGTETASCVSTRGVYDLPAEVNVPPRLLKNLTVSAYEMAAPGWAYYAEREWAAQDDCPYVAGEFIWTGMDYLGEPTPYYHQWPSRSAYFGAVDLAGLPKNRFYGYKARWTNDDVLHIFPHWNWEGMEGQKVPVHVYTSFPMVELFVNDISYGKRTFTRTGSVPEEKSGVEIPRYRLMWDDVVYQPGTVKAVAYDDAGNAAAEAVVRTAGKPDHLVLTADRDTIAADGDDLVYITAAIADADGVVCPLADNRITFAADGAGELLTTDSGDQRENESFARPDKKALAGYTVACVRSLRDVSGKLTVSASAEGLCGASVIVEVK